MHYLDTSIFNHDQMSLAKFKPPKRNGNQGNYQVHADQPSQTIRSEHHMNIQAHYRTLKPEEPDNRDYWRRLTVRECARLQTFPDDFWFAGCCSVLRVSWYAWRCLLPDSVRSIAGLLFLSVSCRHQAHQASQYSSQNDHNPAS